jgi:hypothetical protein
MDYYDNRFHPADTNEYDNTNNKELENFKSLDVGYNFFYRLQERPDGRLKKTKVEFYTSGQSGSKIRDAETGVYYAHKVGSEDEDLYFKVRLVSGICKNPSGYTTIFCLSPNHYMRYFGEELPNDIINEWEKRKNDRICKLELDALKRQKIVMIN